MNMDRKQYKVIGDQIYHNWNRAYRIPIEVLY